MNESLEHEEAANAQVPALIEKAHTQIKEYLKKGAHVLCPLEVTNPPPGFIPRVVAVHISSNPEDREVYVIQKGYEGFNGVPGQPDKLEFTKIGNMKICDMLGISWDDERSRRIDDGRNPVEVVYKAVGYRIDYQGSRQQIEGISCINLDALRDEMVNNKTEQAKAYLAKQGTQDWKKVPAKWKKAIESNEVAEQIEREVRADMLKKRLKMHELADTGAKLRAIRSKGFRTTYTAKELEKDFVDVRMFPLGNTPEAINKAGAAFKNLFGTPESQEGQRPEEVIIETKAKREPEPTPKPHAASKKSILVDFDASDQEQAIELVMAVAAEKSFPLDQGQLQAMKELDLRNLISVLLDMPDAAGGGK